MNLLHKLLATFRPFYDFRVLLLLCTCAGIGYLTDPAATLGLASYLAYVIGMWGAALLLCKILMPYLSLSELARSALSDGNRASAIVFAARVNLLIAIALCLMLWGK
ncbi:MAG: hypothetical protein RRY29_03750 [Desulfovibrionaceae bacterium]